MVVLVLTGPGAGAAAAASATPSSSWRCLAEICLGQSRASLAYRFGGYAKSNELSRGFSVGGGTVFACFWRCFNAVEEANSARANRVLEIRTCSPNFQLPDGVSVGTAIPFGQRWHGYRRMPYYLEGGAFG